jgi:HK97 family phage prohead protease
MVAKAAARHHVVVAPNLAGIPGEMRARPQWVTHKDGAPCSVATGGRTDYTNSENFARFDDACAKAAERGHDGVGFCLLADDAYTFVDVDHCVGADGTIAPIVLNLLRRLGAYVQYSMHDGAHGILKARKPVTDCVFWLTDPASGEKFKVEVYDRDRYIRMTGRTPVGLPTQIADGQDALDALIAELDARPAARARVNGHARRQSDPAQPQEVSEISDEEVIQRALALAGKDGEAIARLFDRGRGRPDESIDDWQMFRILGRVTGDAEQIDRIARSTPLRRPRWDELRCGETKSLYDIRRALDSLDEHDEDGDGGDDLHGDHAADDLHHDDHRADLPPQGQCSADTDEVAELKQQLAAKTAECAQWRTAYAALVALVMNLLGWKKAYDCLKALLLTPDLKHAEKQAQVSAALALAAPIAEPTQTGIKALQETRNDDGTIGLLLSGYASRFGEVDLHGEVIRKGAFAHIKDEWGATARPPVFYNHGFDDAIGFRPIGETLAYKVDGVGLHVDVWVPREPDHARFSGAALRRFKDVYANIAAGKTAGLSVGGTYTTVGQGIKRWNMSELSIVDKPALPSATFVLRR